MKIKTLFNPSQSATACVTNPLPIPIKCRFCKHPVRAATHQEEYGRDYSDWPYMYYCEECEAYVGLHPFTAIPMVTLADKMTRDAHRSSKRPFERFWRWAYDAQKGVSVTGSSY
ncbi:zinc-finger-containing protein [Citrobacter sp. S-77]|uniref:zinc-finger-containing protein n=1 Tax=Citrobacter sp. S-77 TaxID=1080067 RepID=UPI0008FFCB74